MNNEFGTGPGAKMFAAVFSENWQNARHIKTERISFLTTFSLVTAGVLTFLQTVRSSAVLQVALLVFMWLFSLFGFLTSLRLKGELEECLAKIQAMTARANVSEFAALELGEQLSRYPKFRWIFPTFYFMSSAGFAALVVYRVITGKAI
ncbi:MAG: hypothetical protein ACM3SP_03145 [Chloroflexota bacterium]